MKKLLCLILIAHINLSAENSWSSPVAINDGSTLFSASGGAPALIWLNDSGTALTFFANSISNNPQVFVCNSSDFGMNWSAPEGLNTDPSKHFASESGSTFISLNQQGRAVFSWLDIDSAGTTGTLKAALFDNSTGWTVTGLDNLTFMMQPKGNTTSVIGNNNRAVVSWIKNTGVQIFDLKSSFNNGSGWIEKTIASIMNDMNSTPSLFLSMNPSGEFLFASWIQDNIGMNTKTLNVSRYDIMSATWESSTTLSSLAETPDFSPIFFSDSGTAIAQWVESDSMSQKSLKTRIYQNGMWSPSKTTHSMVGSMDSIQLGPLSLNDQGHAILSWRQGSSTQSLKFSFFDGSMWSTATDILTDVMSSAQASFALNDSDLALFAFPNSDGINAGHSQLPSTMFAINILDSNALNNSPYFTVNLNNQGTGLTTWFSSDMMMPPISVKAAFFSSGTWTTLDVPDSTSLPMPMFFLLPACALNSEGNGLLSWGQEGSTLFYTSTNSSSSGPTPPSEASGYQTFSQFNVSTDLINVLSWQPSTTANVSYRIYRNGMLIGTSYSPSYDDHQQIPGKVVNYSITAVNESGSQSAPILFTVAPLTQ